MDVITRQLRRDPERALERMLSEYTGLVYHTAAAILGRGAREEIEEIANDAFLAVYRGRDTLDFSSGSVKAYLCATARNLAIDRLRKKVRTTVVPLDEFSAASEQTEQLALDRIESGALVNQILSLGEPDSTILICRYYFGMPTKQIAKQVSLKENTIDQRLRRALKKLRDTEKGVQFYVK